MKRSFNVGLVSHGVESLAKLETLFKEEQGVACSRILLEEGSGYPEQADLDRVDVLLILVGDNWQLVVDAVQKRAGEERPSIVFTGPVDGAEVIRMAFKAGVHDYIDEKMDSATLVQAVH